MTVELAAGDVAILPAGTGHKNEGASNDLLVVGGYPSDKANWDLKRAGDGDTSEYLEVIRSVPLPSQDPIFGTEGPLIEHWYN